MADDDQPPMIQVRRSTAIRVGIALAVLVALGVGFGIGYAVHSPTTTPAKKASSGSAGGNGTYQHFFENSTTSTTLSSTTTTAASTTTTTNPARQVLSPATTPPVADECSDPISQSADGNPYPTICPADGGINVVAWRYIANSYSNILGLGASASEQQVLHAMCNSPTPGGEISTAANVAAAYYGWPFANDPAFTGWYPGNPTDCSG